MSISPALKKEVEEFLRDFRECSKPYNIFLVERDKNDDFFIRSGITKNEIQQILYNELSAKHYIKGPEQELDPNHPRGIVYFFKFPWEDYQIYIKLKISERVGIKLGTCLSFHD